MQGRLLPAEEHPLSRDNDPDHGGWHPLLAACEVAPGRWIMVDPHRRPYGLLQLVRRGDQIGYRAERRMKDDSTRLVGYYRTLRSSATAVHRAFVSDHAARGDLPADVPNRWAKIDGPITGPTQAGGE